MKIWLNSIVLVFFAIIALIGAQSSLAGIEAVDDEALAGISAQTGINLYGSLKATSGALTISGTAGALKLGGWQLNNAKSDSTNLRSATAHGFSQWGPFTIDVGYHDDTVNDYQRAAIRIGLGIRDNANAPTWIFKHIQMYRNDNTSYGSYNWASPLADESSAGSGQGWIDIGGLYLVTIELWETYLDIFNDGDRSVSQIQGFGQLAGEIDRIIIQYGYRNYGGTDGWDHDFDTNSSNPNGAVVIDGLTFDGDGTGTSSSTNFMTLGRPAGGRPLAWDNTSNFQGEGYNTMRIWFPFHGSIHFDNLGIRDTSYNTAGNDPNEGRAQNAQSGYTYTTNNNGYLNLGPVYVDNINGMVSIDFPARDGGPSFFNY